MMNDITWKEHNIHHSNNAEETNHSQDNDDDDSDQDCFQFQLFSKPNEELFQTLNYTFQFPLNSNINQHLNSDIHIQSQSITPTSEETGKNTMTKQQILKFKGQEEINTSTGLCMWLGSEVMANFLLQHAHFIHKCHTVLELGAGLGLCGIACHYLGAQRVLLTDGDSSVLENLRYNVRQNVHPSRVRSNSSAISNDDECGDYGEGSGKGSGKGGGEGGVDVDGDGDGDGIVSCLQHIWGQSIPQFIDTYGQANIIIATDCVYMPQSLEPLWQSIDQLLIDTSCTNHTNENYNGEGMFVYTNQCSSAAPIERVLEMGTKYGFTWTSFRKKFNDGANLCGDDDDNNSNMHFVMVDEEQEEQHNKNDNDLADRVFIFRRLRRGMM
jgi:predicted nicotinamide N-methyase